MKKWVFVLFIFLFMAKIVKATPIYNSNNGHFYESFGFDGISWSEAKSAAEGLIYLGMQGHLATLTSAEENSWVWNNVGSKGYILGATDEVYEGVWEWVTGEPWVYTNWDSGEPNDRWGEDYLAFGNYGGGKWNDLAHGLGYIVEFELVPPVPEPSTLLLLGAGIAGIAVFRKKFRV